MTGDGRVPEFCRGINERILEHAETDPVSLVCECARPDCFVNVTVPAGELEAAIAAGELAIVATGHGEEATLVRRERGYDVVVVGQPAGVSPYSRLLGQLPGSREAPLQHPLVG